MAATIAISVSSQKRWRESNELYGSFGLQLEMRRRITIEPPEREKSRTIPSG
jgi:hypothetical protein